MDNEKSAAFWNGFLRAAETEPQTAVSEIQGGSGLGHRVAALGLDKSRRRLIVVCPAEDSCSTAFAQADLQAAFKSVQVIAVRPSISEGLTPSSGEGESRSARPRAAPKVEGETQGGLAADIEAGLCFVPLGEFTPDEVEAVADGGGIEGARETLRRRGILQYFFPAPDHLALGLVESGRMRFLPQLIDQLVRTPDMGHPFGPTELIPRLYSFTEMMKELQNLGLVKEGERGLLVTEEGLRERDAVRDKAREGLLFKSLNQFSANLFLKSLLHPRP